MHPTKVQEGTSSTYVKGTNSYEICGGVATPAVASLAAPISCFWFGAGEVRSADCVIKKSLCHYVIGHSIMSMSSSEHCVIKASALVELEHHFVDLQSLSK
jgi:hypothetical protein